MNFLVYICKLKMNKYLDIKSTEIMKKVYVVIGLFACMAYASCMGIKRMPAM